MGLTSGGCLDIGWREAGEPCQSHGECVGRCVPREGVKLCHDPDGAPCDVGELPEGIPCVRALRDGETQCDDRVLAGTLSCESGQTICRLQRHRYREVPGNGCDDDNDGQWGPDEPMDLLCGGSLERGYFTGYEGQSGATFGAADATYFGAGWGEQRGFTPWCSSHPSWKWVEVRDGQGIGGIVADASHPPPRTAAEFFAYAGPMVRWDLPPMTAADHFDLTIWMADWHADALCGHRPGALDALHVWRVDESGAAYQVPVSMEIGLGSGPTAVAPCVPLSRGRNALYILTYSEAGCSWDAISCPGAPLIAPELVQWDP